MMKINLPPVLSATILTISLLQPGLTASEFELTDQTIVRVSEESGVIEVHHQSRQILSLQSIQFDWKSPLSLKVEQGSHEGCVNITASYPVEVDFWHHADDESPRIASLWLEAIPGGVRLHGSPEWAEHVTLVLKDSGDHAFGLSEPLQPHNQLSPDLRGSVIEVEVKSDGETLVENYASAFSAFYMSSAGYGAFFDTFERGRYHFASIEQTHRITHATGALDWYVFFGTNGTDILRSYYQVIGAPKAVPIWAMGPVLWRDDNAGGAAEILADAQGFDQLRIPATAWFVDRPYSDGAHQWSHMNFGQGFENPGEWIATLRHTHGVEFMTWTSTAFFGDARFTHHLDDWHTYLDLSDPESVQAFQHELKTQQYVHGVRGHKMDRADERFPSYAPWTDASITEPFRRNRYVYLFSKVHHDALTQAWGDEHFNFARAAYHRVQPYLSAIWGGDPRSSWAGFRGNFANAMRVGFMGFPIWGSDVGGYLGEGNIPEDLYIRWLQAGAMSGLFEIKLDGAGGSGKDRMPWHYSTRLQNIFREVCEERMRLLPTLFSLANRSATQGVLMQPMAYADLTDPATYDLWDQFFLGDSILVAPVFDKQTERTLYLPKGNWHAFDDPTTVIEGARRITVDAPLHLIPRFVRANSLYISGNIYRGSDRQWASEQPQLTLHLFPGSPGESYRFIYIDPSSPEHERIVHLHSHANQIEVEIPALPHDTRLEWVTTQAVESVLWKGQELPLQSHGSLHSCQLSQAALSTPGILQIRLHP